MDKVTGLVLEVGEKECLVLGPGNEYVRLRLPETRPQVGEIIESYRLEPIRRLANRPVSRVWAYVASILITLVLGGYQVYATNSTPTAYVSLDMTPSVELVLNSRGKVIRAESYNPQGLNLLEQVQVEDLPVKDALKELAAAAADKNNSGSTPVVLTYTAATYLQGDELNLLVVDTLAQHNFRGQLLSQPINLKFREKAANAKLSPGEQLVLDLAGETKLTAADLERQSLPQVLQDHNIKLEQLTGSDKDLESPPLLLPISPSSPSANKAPADQNNKGSEAKPQQKAAPVQAAPVPAKPDVQLVLLSTAQAPAPTDQAGKYQAGSHPEKKAKQDHKAGHDKRNAAPAKDDKSRRSKGRHFNAADRNFNPNRFLLTFLGAPLS